MAVDTQEKVRMTEADRYEAMVSMALSELTRHSDDPVKRLYASGFMRYIERMMKPSVFAGMKGPKRGGVRVNWRRVTLDSKHER